MSNDHIDDTSSTSAAMDADGVLPPQQQQLTHDHKQQPSDPPQEEWRRWLGAHIRDTSSSIDANLTLFRLSCLLVAAGSLAAAVRFSGMFQRFNRVEEIPLWYFSHHKKLRVRIVRQCALNPSVFYVYHTPLLRRVVLQDTLPPVQELYDSNATANLLAVRPFGVQVDETAHEWVWSNFVASHRYMTIELLHRLSVPGPDDTHAVATCHLSLRRRPFRRDFAHEVVASGYGECLPESLDTYDDGTDTTRSLLTKRLMQLATTQKHAQVMQYGIWKDWQDATLSSRMLSASKRMTARSFQKLVDKITPL